MKSAYFFGKFARACILPGLALAAACAHSVDDSVATYDPPAAPAASADASTASDSADKPESDAASASDSESEPDAASAPDSDSDTDSASVHDSGSDSDSATDSAPDSAPDSGPVCATVPPNDKCGLDPQCGCASNETCDVTDSTTGATSCITAGTLPVGSPCASTGSCALGLTCQMGACRPYCASAGNPCSSPAGVCFDPQNASGQATPNLHVCSIRCDVRNSAASCPNGGSCWFFQSSNDTDCRPAGTQVQDGTCDGNGQLDCAPGYACAGVPPLGLINVCMGWCRLSQGNADCTGGTTCNDWLNPAPSSGGSKLGLCF